MYCRPTSAVLPTYVGSIADLRRQYFRMRQMAPTVSLSSFGSSVMPLFKGASLPVVGRVGHLLVKRRNGGRRRLTSKTPYSW